MKTLRILCTGDWHVDADNRNQKLKHSLDQIVDYLTNNKIDYFIHSGDMYDTPRMFKEGSGIELVFEYLRKISKLVKYMVITRGNAFHDAASSISLLHKIELNVLAFENPVILGFFKEKEEETN